jgi:uncharacterized protein YndB with AHSA1/START domain
MISENYTPGAAFGAEIKKDGEKLALVLVRDLKHPPARVWQALTDPEHLKQWAPFDVDRNLAATGPVRLSWIGAPQPLDTVVKRAEAPKLLEYSTGDNVARWELEPLSGGGTRLTLWHSIDRPYAAMGAAGWHISFDVLEQILGGQHIERMAGPALMKLAGWQRLTSEYGKLFGVEAPSWPGAQA